MNELVAMDKARLDALVANLPPKKRAAFSKAAKAAVQHLKDSRANYAKAYELASAMVENWWLLGLEIPRLGVSVGSGMKKRSRQGDNVLTLTDIGINSDQSARCQKLAEKSKAELQEWLDSKYDEEKYYLPSLRPAAEALANEFTGEMEWYTPEKFIEPSREVLGEIDLDPASNEHAQSVVKAARYFTADDDGLSQEWSGRVFLNPPYKMPLVEQFVFKLCDHVESKDVTAAILLTNNCTDPKWWQRAARAATAVCFTAGRISFYNKGGEFSSPTNGQTFMYFGKALKRFEKNFEEIGLVLR